MKIPVWVLLLGGGAAAAAVVGAASKPKPEVQQFFVAANIGTGNEPPPPPPKPDAPSGSQQIEGDKGRAWFTCPISRDGPRERKHPIVELVGFSDGEIVVDVYEQIDPPGDLTDLWGSYKTACGAQRWRIRWKNGIMTHADQIYGVNGEGPVCFAAALPISHAYRRDIWWTQEGPQVFLNVRTTSGLIRRPYEWEKLYKDQDGCKYGGQCDRWDNDTVDSGHVLFDALWREQ